MRLRASAQTALTFMLVLFGAQTFARTQSGVETLNGYEVHFVDAASGDDISVSFQIPLGRLSESGKHIGRARLLQTFLAAQISVPVKAFTDLGSTSYSSDGKMSDARAILGGVLAPLREVNWNEEMFKRARAVVEAEAGLRGPVAEEDYLFAMMFDILLPKQHAWHATPLGDPDAISKMSLAGLRDYWLANYRSANAKITVRGNFSDPLAYENVKIWAAESLQPPQKAVPRSSLAPLALKWAPSLFFSPNSPTEGDRKLYLASTRERFQLVIMEGDVSQHQEPPALEKLVAKLNERPFAKNAEAFFYSESIGNKVHLVFLAKPKKAEEGEALYIEALRRIRAEQLSAGDNPAHLFHPQRALYVEMGPEVEEMEMDERFRRAYKLIDNRAAMRRYSLPFEVEACEARLRGRVSEIGG